jgi:hypothetical protein
MDCTFCCTSLSEWQMRLMSCGRASSQAVEGRDPARLRIRLNT